MPNQKTETFHNVSSFLWVLSIFSPDLTQAQSKPWENLPECILATLYEFKLAFDNLDENIEMWG